MPRRINLVAVAAGKLVLAIEEELGEAMGSPDTPSAFEVMSRAKTLQHAAHNRCVRALLNGRTVVEYLDTAWVALHPKLRLSVEGFELALSAHDLQ